MTENKTQKLTLKAGYRSRIALKGIRPREGEAAIRSRRQAMESFRRIREKQNVRPEPIFDDED